jgi:transposase-like protein
MLIRGCSPGSLMPIRPWDHPDLVLARAITTAVLDREEALLIASTRLENRTLVQVAAQLDISPQTASDWRARAEQRLKKAIEDGDLAFVPLRARRQRPNSGNVLRAVGQRLGSRSGSGAAFGTQQRALVGKSSDRKGPVAAPRGSWRRRPDRSVFALASSTAERSLAPTAPPAPPLPPPTTSPWRHTPVTPG